MTIAFVGMTAYRTAFDRPHAKVGGQPERIGSSVVWLLPKPSGLNAHYGFQDFVRLFSELRRAAE